MRTARFQWQSFIHAPPATVFKNSYKPSSESLVSAAAVGIFIVIVAVRIPSSRLRPYFVSAPAVFAVDVSAPAFFYWGIHSESHRLPIMSTMIMLVKVTVNTIVVKGNQDITLDVKAVFETDVVKAVFCYRVFQFANK